MSSFVAFLLIVLLWRLWLVVYRYWFHPLAHVPGPFLGCVSNLYRIGWFIRTNEHILQDALHAKYGSVVRYSPNKLIINDTSLLPVVYHMKADKTDFTAPNFGNVSLFTLQSHKAHVTAKRRIAYAYSMKNVQTFESDIDQRLCELMDFFSQTTTKEGSINVLSPINWLGFDVVSQLCFGQPFGFVKQQEDINGLIHNFTETAWLGEFLGELDNISWYVRNTWIGRYLLVPRPTDPKGIGAVMGHRDRIMQELVGPDRCVREDVAVNSFLCRFLQARNKDGSAMSMEDVKAEILLAMQAGSENAALNLALVIFNIARHPVVQKKLQAELDGAEKTGAIASRGSITSFDEVYKLPYLGACIRESLRYSSSITQIARKSPPGSGLKLDKIYVPPSVSVSTSAWIIGRDKKLYGDDAYEYRPERWLEASKEDFKRMEALDFVFGHGARRCLGRHMAFLEIWKTVAEIFRRFNVKFDEPSSVLPMSAPSNWHAKFYPRMASSSPTASD